MSAGKAPAKYRYFGAAKSLPDAPKSAKRKGIDTEPSLKRPREEEAEESASVGEGQHPVASLLDDTANTEEPQSDSDDGDHDDDDDFVREVEREALGPGYDVSVLPSGDSTDEACKFPPRSVRIVRSPASDVLVNANCDFGSIPSAAQVMAAVLQRKKERLRAQYLHACDG